MPEFDSNLPTIPVWVQPLDTGQPSAADLNDLGKLPKANFAAANQIIPITYGRDRMFGQPFVVHVDEDNGNLHTAMSFCEGQIAGFEQIIISGENALVTGKAFEGLKNRGFENGDKTGWDLEVGQDGTISSTEAHTGIYSCRLNSLAGGPNQFSNRLKAPPADTAMTVRGWIMRDPLALPDASARIYIRDATTVGGALSVTTGITGTSTVLHTVAGWQFVEFTYTVPTDVVEYIVELGESAGTTGGWYYDDISMVILDPSDATKEIGIEVVPYVGSQSQQFDSMLRIALTGYADDLPGTAYISMRTPAGSTTGFPRLEAIVQGRLVYDPRKDDSAGALGPELTFTRTGSGWFRDWEGLYREADIDNEPRMDASRRVQNLFTNTNDYTHADWDKGGSVVSTAPTVLGYDGKTDVWELRDNNDAGSGVIEIDFDFTMPADGKETYSFEVKAGAANIPVCLFQLTGLTSTSNYIYVTLADGSVHGSGLEPTDQWKVEDKGDGWLKISITVLGDSTAKAVTLHTYMAEAVSDTTITRDGTNFWYFRNLQRENVIGQADHHASEYIESGATSAARTFNTDREGLVLLGSRIVRNEVENSEDFTLWTNSNTVDTLESETLNGYAIHKIEATVASNPNIQGDILVSAAATEGRVYAAHVWLRGGTDTNAVLQMFNNGGSTWTHVTAEVLSGPDVNFGSFGSTNLTITDLSTTEFSHIVVIVTPDGTTGTPTFYLKTDIGTPVIGDSIFASQPQFEEVTSQGYRTAGEYQVTGAAAAESTYTVDLNGEDLPGGRGMLCEASGTNVADGSNDITPITYWAHQNGGTYADALSVFPDWNGTYFTNDNVGTSVGINQFQGTFTDGRTDVLSFIVENDDATVTTIGIHDATAAAFVHLAIYTWATGVLATNIGSGNLGVEHLGIGPNGGEMVRIWLSATGTAAGTGATGNSILLYNYGTGTGTNGESLWYHHGQFETGVNFPSSPIVTPDASDVTRNAELPVSTDGSWINAVTGTVYCQFEYPHDYVSGFPVPWNIDDGSSTDAIQQYVVGTNNNSATLIKTASVSQGEPGVNNADPQRKHHFVGRYAADNLQSFLNSQSSAVDTSVTLPSGLNDLRIGHQFGGGNHWSGYIGALRFYSAFQTDEWAVEASKGNTYDNAPNFDDSLTMAFNFARDMSLQGAGNVRGSGAHRVDDSTTWEFSQNPTLCFRDMVDNFTGWGILDAGVVANANYNDEVLSGTRRRDIGLSLARANTVDSWVKGFRAYMGAFLNWEGGKIRVIPNRPDVEAPGALSTDGGALSAATVGNVPELDFSATQDFSAELAFKPAVSGGGATQMLFGKKIIPTGLFAGWAVYMDASDQIAVSVSDGTNGFIDTDTTTNVMDGEWHTVAFTVDQVANELIMAVDGVPRTPIDITAMTLTLASGSTVRIGANSGNGDLYDGLIDEVRVWDDVRTPAELAANRLTEITTPLGEANLIGYWKLNDSPSATVAVDSSINALNATLDGAAVFVSGNPQIIPDGVAMHITSDDIVKDSLDLKRRSLRSVPNSVAIDYEDSSGARWFTARTQADSPRVVSGAEARRLSRVSLPGVHSASQAQREATERLNWYLTDLECTLALFDEGWELTHGSIVAVTHPIGLDAKLFRVRQSSGASGRWVVDLTEYDPAIYSDVVVADPTIPDTNLGDPLNPPTVTGLTLAEELFNYKTGTTGSRVRVSWNATGFPFLSQYLVEGFVAGAKVWQTFTGANNIVSPPVEEIVDTIGTPTDYEVRVYVQSPFASGAAAIDNVQIDGKFAIPSDPTGAVAVQTFADGVDLTWVAAVDIDIWRYEVRRGTTSDTWATATSLVFVDGLEFSEQGLALGTHRYFIKAIDSVKQESTNAAFVDVTLSAPTAVTGLFGFEVASEVRLNWAAVTGEFAERYRIAYSDIPETFETTLDVVDTIRFSTKDVPEGTFTFKAYTQDKVGNEAATAAEVEIEVTSDADAFLADTYNFSFRPDTEPHIVANGSLTNFVEWNIRTDEKKYYVTNMGDSFAVSPTDFVAADPLANYHSTGASEWLSETVDFGLLLTGSWNLTHDTVSLQGNVDIALELSTDDVTYVSFGGSSKGEFRYARVRISTLASPGTATAFVKSPIMQLKINVVPLEESGEATSSPSAGVGKTVNLSREYTALKEITTQPKNTIASGSAVTSIVDNIVIGPNTGIKGDGLTTLRAAAASATALDFGATQDFTIEWTAKHSGGTGTEGVMSKRGIAGPNTGWDIRHVENTEEITIVLDEGVNQVVATTTDDAFPNDGQWHHYAMTVDRTGDQLRIFKDLVEVSISPVDISSLTLTLVDATADFYLMAIRNSDFNIGSLDEVRIWDDIRTAQELSDNKDVALDMTVTQTNLVGYWTLDGGVGVEVVITGDDVLDLSPSGIHMNALATGLTYVDPGNSGNVIQKINSFDVFIFDTFGQQLAEEFQWKWKAV